MAWLNKFRQLAGNTLDAVGTALHLPEMGLSEAYAGGATQNTGKQNLNTLLTPAATEKNYNKIAYGQNVTGNLGAMYNSPQVLDANAQEKYDAAVAMASGKVANDKTTGYANFGNGAPVVVGGAGTGSSGSGGSDGSGGSTAATVVQPDLVFYGGKYYDKNKPDEALAYYDRRVQDGDTSATQQLGAAEESYKRAIAASADTQTTSAAELDRRMGDVNSREATYAKGYDQRVNQFGTDQRIGSANRQNAFAAMGANAFQSAQADEQIASNKKYDEGLTSLADERNTNATTFANQRTSLGDEKKGLITKYDQYLSDTNHALNDNKTKITQGTNDFKQGLVADLAPNDVTNGITNFADRYKLSEYNPTDTQTVDLSKYTPYTSFSTLGGQQGVSAGNPFANIAANANPTDTYLGGRDSNKSEDPLKKYLYAKA